MLMVLASDGDGLQGQGRSVNALIQSHLHKESHTYCFGMFSGSFCACRGDGGGRIRTTRFACNASNTYMHKYFNTQVAPQSQPCENRT